MRQIKCKVKSILQTFFFFLTLQTHYLLHTYFSVCSAACFFSFSLHLFAFANIANICLHLRKEQTSIPIHVDFGLHLGRTMVSHVLLSHWVCCSPNTSMLEKKNTHAVSGEQPLRKIFSHTMKSEVSCASSSGVWEDYKHIRNVCYS